MKKIRVYNDSEIKILVENSNVERIKNKSQIIYKNSFKLWAIKEKLLNSSKTARQIFIEAGFDMNILDDRTPQRRLSSWLKKYEKFGKDYFLEENKYSYKALEKINKENFSETEKRFTNPIQKVMDNSKFVAFIIDKEDFKNICKAKQMGSLENEKTDC